MQRPVGVDAEAWLRQCVNRAQAVPMDETRKEVYIADLAILSGLVYNLDTVRTIIAEETMYESSVVQHFAEQGIKQGIEQGIGQGTVEALLDVLEIRFGLVASDPLADRIGAIDDVQRLKQLHRAAIQVPQPRSLQQPVRRRRVKALRNITTTICVPACSQSAPSSSTSL